MGTKVSQKNNGNIRTRFAPSPTGSVHIGSIQKIVYSYACAKQVGGQYLLRIEDTDQKRYVEGAEQELYDLHEYLGLDVDESPVVGGDFGPYRQSERLDLYKKYVEHLIEDGHAYYAFETPEELEQMRKEQQEQKKQPKYIGKYRDLDASSEEVKARLEAGDKYVVRIKTPKGEKVTFKDIIMGEITVNTDDLDDYVLLKSDGFPTYHLANVVDDHLMEITHVFRGVEWLPTAPIHFLLYGFFDWEAPAFAHIPNILDPKGGKLSKRSGSVAAFDFFKAGYLPEAIMNFIILLGWSPKTDQEIISLDEFIEKFALANFNKSNPVFNRDKLGWFNQEYIRSLDDKTLKQRFDKWLKDFPGNNAELAESIKKLSDEQLRGFLALEKERITLFSDLSESVKLYIGYPDKLDFSHKLLKKIGNSDIQKILEKYKEVVTEKTFETHEKWEQAVRQIVNDLGYKPGEVFMTIRIGVTGVPQSPPIFEFVEVIGEEEQLNRLDKAIEKLKS